MGILTRVEAIELYIRMDQKNNDSEPVTSINSFRSCLATVAIVLYVG